MNQTQSRAAAYDKDAVKLQASGREVEILEHVAGIPPEYLSGKETNCPKCGGNTRFRLVDSKAGSVFCSHCFSERNGDYLSAVQWMCHCTFPEAIRLVGEYLNGTPTPVNGKARSAREPKPRKRFPSFKEALANVERYKGKHSAFWPYHDANGEPVAAAVRWDDSEGNKAVLPFSRTVDGWANEAPAKPRTIYNLPAIITAETVVVTEGEKASDAAGALGFIATTSPMGSGAARLADWSPLAGKTVWILPDADEPGRKYAEAVASILAGLGCTVRVIELPGLPPGGDVVDWIAGRPDSSPDELRAEIEGLSDEAAEWSQDDAEADPPDDQEDDMPEYLRYEEASLSDFEESEPQAEPQEETEPPQPRFRIYSSAELDAMDIRVEYLIEDVLPLGQFGTIIAIDKCLKTHTAAELAVSVATGTPCFEYFAVSEPRPTLVMTGESGLASTQNMARRIARAHEYRLSDVPNLFWSNEIPNATRPEDLVGLEDIIEQRGIKLAILDPGYLMTPGVQAGQITEMGAVLRGFIEICTRHNCTIVAVVHARKPNYGGVNQKFRFTKPERTDVSGSGWAEACRFWILLKPRADLIVGDREKGEDRRWFNWFGVGGSAGHSGMYGLDVNEGIHDRERGGMTKWETTIRKECDIVRERIEDRQSKNDAEYTKLERAIRKALTDTYADPIGPTATNLRTLTAGVLGQSSLSKARFDRVFDVMLNDGHVVTESSRSGKNATYRLSEDPHEL